MESRRMSRRILLLGANGQVGWELLRSLQPLGEVICTRRSGRNADVGAPIDLDLQRLDDVGRVVRDVQPQVIVNAAAYTAVDRAENDVETAHVVNALAPGVLAEEAARLGAALIHYSTDYVFDGGGQRPWREDDAPAPVNVYGRTKLAGEEAIRSSGAAHLILRTSWVYGVHGANFVKTMLRLGAERSELKVVNDQVGAPTSARVIADMTAQVLALTRENPSEFLSQHGGIIHLACAGEVSWHAFALEIFRVARDLGLVLKVQEVRPIPSREYPTPARRPRNSRLDCTRLRERLGLITPDWRIALRQCLEEALRPGIGVPPSQAGAGELESRRAATPAARNEPAADLDIGVIYTHERYWLPRLLSSLAQSGDDLRLRLLLVDNASADGTGPWESRIGQTTVLRNTRRLGYAENLNRILEASTAPLVLLLNTDMSFDPEEQCLSKMVRFMREHPDCGVSGCRLYRPDGAYGYPARRFQTPALIAARRTPLAALLRGARRRHFYCDRPHTDTFECDWLSGCFLLVRREAYQQVGGLDCGFRKYFEDVDFCARMARAGWRVMFHGATYCYHYEQRASKRLLSRDAWQHLRSYARWLRKWGMRPRMRVTR
jgi:dTDP-4-dehydrorhamnose reductase